jgi:hypothetical protein
MVCAQHHKVRVDAAAGPRRGALCNVAMLFAHFLVQTFRGDMDRCGTGEPAVEAGCAVNVDS